ncbi:MAG: PD-(D/E)XK nuclease family protein [Nitratireductor sp.]
MEKSWCLLVDETRSFISEPLDHWAQHVRSEVTKAVVILPQEYASHAYYRCDPIEKWFGLKSSSHAFSHRPQPWLALTEIQVMKGFGHFTRTLGDGAFKAIFASFSPERGREVDGPFECMVEETVEGTEKRIDMVLRSLGRQPLTIAIEAKYGSSISNNPLDVYEKHIERTGPAPCQLIILDFTATKRTEMKIGEHRRWVLLSWFVFMSRLEKELSTQEVFDPEYAKFRSLVI